MRAKLTQTIFLNQGSPLTITSKNHQYSNPQTLVFSISDVHSTHTLTRPMPSIWRAVSRCTAPSEAWPPSRRLHRSLFHRPRWAAWGRRRPGSTNSPWSKCLRIQSTPSRRWKSGRSWATGTRHPEEFLDTRMTSQLIATLVPEKTVSYRVLMNKKSYQ